MGGGGGGGATGVGEGEGCAGNAMAEMAELLLASCQPGGGGYRAECGGQQSGC